MLSVKTGDIEKFIHHTVLSQNWHQADTNENESVTMKTHQSKHSLEHTLKISTKGQTYVRSAHNRSR